MVRPLSRRDAGGEYYRRPPAIETQIERALAEDTSTIERRLAATDRTSPDHLRSETLVHLMRDLLRRREERLAGLVLRVLLVRCEANLKAKLSRTLFTAAAEEILGNFSELFAIDAAGDPRHELDFYECKFNRAFMALRTDQVRSEKARLTHETRMPEVAREAEVDDGEDLRARVSNAFHCSAEQEASSSFNQLRAGIEALPDDDRNAVVLCHVLGYDVESVDPEKVTAATRCGVSGRTIRNRLASAAEKLSRFKEDV